MVLPVTGPFTVTESLNYPPPHGSVKSYYRRIVSSRQKKPYDLRLPHTVRCGFTQNLGNPTYGPLAADSALHYGANSVSFNEATSKAYAKLTEDAKQKCQASVALAEYRQAAGMVGSRLVQLTKFARAVKRLDFHTAATYLSLSPNTSYSDVSRQMKKRWRKDKDLAGVWLEVHFGWEPMVKDIYDALEVAVNPVKDKPIKGRATGPLVRDQLINRPVGSANYVDLRQCKVQYLADLRVTNPNLAQLSQWGITNPLSLVWELIPFSFVVDWFVNVSQLIGTFDDWFGVSLTNSSTTVYNTCNFKRWFTPPPDSRQHGQFYDVTRSAGITKPVLYVKPLKGPSWQRALTQASLLLALMPKSRTSADRFGWR